MQKNLSESFAMTLKDIGEVSTAVYGNPAVAVTVSELFSWSKIQ